MNRSVRALTILCLIALGCHSEESDPTKPAIASDARAGASEMGGLQIQFAGASWETAPKVMILLHGYGASSSDLMPLAQVFSQQDETAYLFPQAPISIGKDSYAWANSNEADYEQSRTKVISLIEQIRQRNPQCHITVGGFSQGATISCNLLSEGDPTLANVLLFSPKPLLFRQPSTTGSRPKIYLSHGRSDAMIPFADVDNLKDDLTSKGFTVNWFPFDGGHEITINSLVAARSMLADSSTENAAEKPDNSK